MNNGSSTKHRNHTKELPQSFCSLLARVVALVWVLASGPVWAQAPDRAAPAHDLDGSFVREWLVLGPFPGRNLETDFLADAGGEANVRPKEGDTVTTTDGKPLVWTRLRSAHDVIDLEQVLGSMDWSVVYAYCEVNSSEPVQTHARMSALSAGALCLNGEMMRHNPTKDPLDQNRFGYQPPLPIHLNAGRTPCLIKLRFESERPYAFAFQPLPVSRAAAEFYVTDSGGRPVSGALIQVYDRDGLVVRLPTDAAGKAEACLYPLAETYHVQITAGDMGTWLDALSVRQSERKRLDIVLQKAISISGQVLAMDGSPQAAIVVQALRISENFTSDQGVLPNQVSTSRSRPPASTTEPQINSTNRGAIRSLLSTPAFSKAVLSDTNGIFHFVNLRPGKYQLRAHGARGYVYPESENGPDASKQVVVEPGRTMTGARFVFAEAKKGVWNTYPIKKGLADANPSILHRSPDGMLWIGTFQHTVHANDGVAFKVFSLPETLGSSVRALVDDRSGTLWIGTDQGIGRMEAGQIQTMPFNDALPGKDVGAIQADPDGTVWFSTTSGLCKSDGQGLSRWSIKEGAPSNVVGALLRSRDGALWMSTSRSLARFDNGNFSEPVLLSGVRRASRERLYQARDGAIWFCSPFSENAAYRYDGKTLFRLGEEDGLDGQVFDIGETSDGVLWFATDKGISRFDGTTILTYTTVDGLGWGGIGGLYVDSDDVIWCIAHAEVSRFDPKGFSGISNRDGLITRQQDAGKNRATSVFAIEPDGQRGYWLGTEWGGIYHLGGEARDLLTQADFFSTNFVRHIHRSADGTLWLGTADGIYKYFEGRAERMLERNWIIGFSTDDQGNVWFGQGWFAGGVTRFNPKTREEITFTRAQGLPNDSVWAVERGGDGQVWIGTAGGLARFRDGQIENVGAQLRIPSGNVQSLRQDTDGALWIGGGVGLLRLEGTNLVSITPPSGPPLDGVWCSVRTADGILWIGTDSNGLLGYDGQAMTLLDKRDGLLGDRIFTLRPDTDGSLLIGHLHSGLTRYRRTSSSPSVRLTELKLEDHTFSEFANVPSTEIGKRVSVQYQEIDLKTHPEKRQFKYRVQSPSGETLFGGITKDRRFEWTPRKGGVYSFEVQAIDRDLNYSKTARLTFHATVPWYANAWITVPGGGTFGGLVIWAFVARAIYMRQRRESERLRERMLRQEREAREALEEKTRQLEKAKEAAETAKEAAEIANKAKSTFLANMSHEIRTPLNAIMGYAQILRRKPSLQADDRAAVKTIEASGDHLLTLINSVLDLSKIEAGSMDLQPVDFDLSQLIQEVAAMFQVQCREKGLEWRVEFECGTRSAERGRADQELTVENAKIAEAQTGGHHPDPFLQLTSEHDFPLVRGDEGKLRQVLINLLGNAVKFTEQGEVVLRIERSHQSSVVSVQLSAPASGAPLITDHWSLVTFSIIDSGPGIPADAQEKLFAPFVQFGDGVKNGGTGLGLAISKRLVELMGGTIGLRSVDGAGASFYFTVPLAPASESVDEQALPEMREPLHLAAGSKVNALIVDDVEQNREVLLQILASLGCQVRVAESGERALELIRLEVPDIVFSDIRMPGMSGLELKNKIVEQFGPGRMRLVAISASVLAHQQKNYLEGGFDDFVGKPFRVARIADCLTRLLSVEFEYESQKEVPTAPKAGDPVADERLVLPEPLLARLRTSAKSYRIVEFKRCLAEVEQLGPEGRRLAAMLEALNQKGEMDKILEILDKLVDRLA